jgi:uncharacterized membrane-anchored protein YitT (DUF2179 family)
MKTMVDPALLIFIISLFLLLLSLILLGKEKTMASIIGSLLFPLFVKITSGLVSNIQIDNSDLLLIVLFAGIFEGFGCGLVFKAGFTTGGTDILNQIASKYAKVSLGTAMLMTDGIIVLSAGFFFGWTRVMYGIIILYLISFIADKVVLGISSSKAFYIVAEKEEEVKQYILNTLGHGVTILEGKGGFTNEKQKIFMCLIPTREYFKVKEGLEEIDKNAFFIVTDAYQSVGGSSKEGI